MTATEIARLRTRAQINGLLRKREALAILDALEQAEARIVELELNLADAWAAVRVRDETINATVKKLKSDRDALRARLKKEG